MKIDPITRVFSRWVSSMHVVFYRLVDGWSPVNLNTLVLTVRGGKTGRAAPTAPAPSLLRRDKRCGPGSLPCTPHTRTTREGPAAPFS